MGGAPIDRLITCLFTPGCAAEEANSDGKTTAADVVAALRALTPTVPRYGIFEQTFNWTSPGYSNPWEQVQVTMTLTPPAGPTVTVGGFYYGPDTWKARFAPAATGQWTWQASISDGMQSAQFSGTFSVVESDAPGFVRRRTGNAFRWVLDDGSPYYPLGIGDCINDVDQSGSPLDNWGFDGGFRQPGDPDYGSITDIDTYFGAYGAAGVNLFRWSVDTCAFGLYDTIDPSGNVYKVQEGRFGDQLVEKLRQYGLRPYMVIFGFAPPFPNDAADASKMAAVQRYVKYVVDRYGASVDFWELMNEYPNPPAAIDHDWYNQIGGYLRSVDPYRHPISTSFPVTDAPPPSIEITSLHWYRKEDELQSDTLTQNEINFWKTFGKPVIFGEQGNSDQNWDERSALRMRIRSWTAFFNEGVLIFRNTSFAKDYRAGVASNIYLGPEERGYLRVLQQFTRGVDRRAIMEGFPIRPDGAPVRGYALRSPTDYSAYLHAFNDHTNPTTGIRITIDVPLAGTATWISPQTGDVLAALAVDGGTRQLNVPSFTTDIALKVEAGGAAP